MELQKLQNRARAARREAGQSATILKLMHSAREARLPGARALNESRLRRWLGPLNNFTSPPPDRHSEVMVAVETMARWAGENVNRKHWKTLLAEASEEQEALHRQVSALVRPATGFAAQLTQKEELIDAMISEELDRRPELSEELRQLAGELNGLVPLEPAFSPLRLPTASGHGRVPAPPPVGSQLRPPSPPPKSSQQSKPPLPPQTANHAAKGSSDSPFFEQRLALRGLTVGDFSELLGLPEATVSELIQGIRPDLEMQVGVKRALSNLRIQAQLPRVTGPALPCWEKGSAVLIGISAYQELESVPSIANNIASLKEVMADGLGIPRANIFAVNDPSTPAEIHHAVEQASDAADPAHGAMLVYFCGHGWTDRGRLMLGLVGSSRSRWWSALPFDNLRIQLADSQISSRVVILDSCYSGAALDILGPDDLASAAAIDGTYVLTSANATTAALAPPGERFTTFTGQLIKALTEGIPQGPPVINAESLYRYIERAARERGFPLPGRQIGGDGDQVEIMPNRWRGML
ncbi:caspase domain-containing protein [Streptomyces sp. NPDC085540]|uniref:caspase domain-containing protein n=1 Tax=Streptomyces sp. NPDC085540 TaxID=3365730 RepID=UPI0037CFC51C